MLFGGKWNMRNPFSFCNSREGVALCHRSLIYMMCEGGQRDTYADL